MASLLELKRVGTPPPLGRGGFPKTKKRQQGCRTPSAGLHKAKYSTGYWKVKENFGIAKWFFADFDPDGRLDAAVTTIGERIELWWNRSSRKHWWQLRRNGKKSNRSANMGIWVPFEGEKRND